MQGWQRTLIRCFHLSWMTDKTPDANHFYRRSFTRPYQVRKRWLKQAWLLVGTLILAYPTAQFALLIGLPAAFISFALLDESRQ